MKTATSSRMVFYCNNCGQPVTGKTARIALNPRVKFCFECAGRLGQDGACHNPGCPWIGRVPVGE